MEQLLSERGPDKEELGVDPLDLNTTRYASGEWRRALAASPFEELQDTRLPNPQTLDRDGVVAFFASMGWIADLPDAGPAASARRGEAAARSGRVPAAVGGARLLDATRLGLPEHP